MKRAIEEETKDYIVIVRSEGLFSLGNFYLDKNLEFIKELGDNVVWSGYSYEEIKEIVTNDAEKWRYTYIIEEFKKEVIV